MTFKRASGNGFGGRVQISSSPVASIEGVRTAVGQPTTTTYQTTPTAVVKSPHNHLAAASPTSTSGNFKRLRTCSDVSIEPALTPQAPTIKTEFHPQDSSGDQYGGSNVWSPTSYTEQKLPANGIS